MSDVVELSVPLSASWSSPMLAVVEVQRWLWLLAVDSAQAVVLAVLAVIAVIAVIAVVVLAVPVVLAVAAVLALAVVVLVVMLVVVGVAANMGASTTCIHPGQFCARRAAPLALPPERERQARSWTNRRSQRRQPVEANLQARIPHRSGQGELPVRQQLDSPALACGPRLLHASQRRRAD